MIYKISRERAAIIKAYLLQNEICDKEEFTVALNENGRNAAYTLGRKQGKAASDYFGVFIK